MEVELDGGGGTMEDGVRLIWLRRALQWLNIHARVRDACKYVVSDVYLKQKYPFAHIKGA